MKFKFDAHQPYQQEAINAVVGLFQGQPADADQLRAALETFEAAPNQLDLTLETGSVGNNLVLEEETILENLREVQNHNGIELSNELADGLQFDIEMETGTGKTYVYLRTAFELARHYRFTKFIILVPSVAIREGVKTSIELMKNHFRELYPELQFDHLVYSGDRAEEVRDFATATSVQFMVMTIDSLRGDKNTRIMHQERDRLNGLKPIDFLAATRPIVIMDEPQNMESELAQSAVGELDPLCALRYSATHRTKRNLVYSLDPVDAHDLGLVKQIVVADATQEGSAAKPYIRLVEVKRNPFVARVELLVKKKDGSVAKKIVNVKDGDDLELKSNGNTAYSGNWRVSGISVAPEMIELTNHGELHIGEEIGGNQGAVFREMIRETIREHFHREAQLYPQGVKVLSLFFIDKVASYLGDGVNNLDASGDFSRWFDELYLEELEKRDLPHLPKDPIDVRSGYFAQMSKGSGRNKVITFKDTTGKTKADDDAYELIMKDKARLLSQDEPVRFIFSHSALREGWDNPNVFQICTLRDMASNTERRQTIGRGLRLPVNSDGERIADRGVAQLTVVANESYKQFAAALQDEYQRAGVNIGFVRSSEFAKLTQTVDGKEKRIGTSNSALIWQSLKEQGFIDSSGQVLPAFEPNTIDFIYAPPVKFEGLYNEIVQTVSKCKVETIIKPKRSRVARKLNKQLYWSQEFEDFWDQISKRTTYRVTVDRDELVYRCVSMIKQAPKIDPIQIRVKRNEMKITRGGPKQSELGSRTQLITDGYVLPDIISQLQEATSLTRRTIVEILQKSGRMEEFLHNPNDFIVMAKNAIEGQLSELLIDGVQYEPIGGQIYELRELQADGQREKDRFLDNLYEVRNKEKTDFDYVVFDSAVEREFAELLDNRQDITMFMKLPDPFKIPTPVGPYNPDWAIVKKDEDGRDHLYLIRETKSSQDPMKRRPSENAKIRAAERHFEAIGLDYKVSAPTRWEI
ncbi:restriction endonuclease [Corynebacterium mustelae]|uniref:Restriction endonuclease n=1 Tax=Corynebacterium mustelae TaxID=571915 RepID=A0A0G3GYU7_9CORY|nr:DEAD/DEAH box helicase family protein [Corynebacterium mustelae]AKK05685.1 restriction endonuclease [Corynebacterium mustelae]